MQSNAKDKSQVISKHHASLIVARIRTNLSKLHRIGIIKLVKAETTIQERIDDVLHANFADNRG